MAASKHIHGARGKLSINGGITDDDGNENNVDRVIGIWNSVDVDWSYDVRASYILGRFSPAALTTVGTEPVNIRASGFVVADHSIFREGNIQPLKNLLLQGDITLTLVDRQTGDVIARIKGCKPTGMSMGLSSKELAMGTNSYVGLLIEQTDGIDDDENKNSANLP